MKKHFVGTVVAVALGSAFIGCIAETDERTGEAQLPQSDAEVAANCTLNNPKKIAVCHIPPGNPANWHTICISKHAVKTHEDHHGDHLGACQPDSGGGGAGAGGSSSGSGGSTSTSSGSGGSTSTSSGSGGSTSGSNSSPQVDNCPQEYPNACLSSNDCAQQEQCLLGCCVPFTN
jgi:hypothetical protein